jgi:phage tail sheath protein FI
VRAYQRAFSLLDVIDEISLVAVPGVGNPGMVELGADYCRQRGDCFFIADLPQSVETVAEAQQAVKAQRYRSSYAAQYFPWLKVRDVNTRSVVAVPPSGAVAGIYARTDATQGIWKAPAGAEAIVRGVAGLAVSVSNREQELLNPLGLNVIRDNVGPAIAVWGAGTMDRNDAEFRYVPVRRTEIFLQESIGKGLEWVAFEPNNETLWSLIRESVSDFMYQMFRKGAFTGAKPDEAYFVKCGRDTTTQEDINNGIVNVVVGFAPLKPAQFVVLKIRQQAGRVRTY